MSDKETLEETIGECLGLERAAQKAVDELDSKGLLKPEAKKRIMGMQNDANGHEQKLQKLVEKVIESEKLNSQSIEEHARETVEKTSEIMKTYLGEDPDELDAMEFLSLAEGGEMAHYEVLLKLAGGVKDKKFATGVRAILQEEKKHVQLCIQLAKAAVEG